MQKQMDMLIAGEEFQSLQILKWMNEGIEVFLRGSWYQGSLLALQSMDLSLPSIWIRIR